eukprot:TRINITY_DN3955_c0_g1_i2.p1 TRINITY_DN3955_c0_g1~~TRINITY_DN3955_c0_g1_i2.p1  ORF type:complete len:887 (+),score=81.80 TRINITY_DN3955_c0_g1_i2:80-2740(+)
MRCFDICSGNADEHGQVPNKANSCACFKSEVSGKSGGVTTDVDEATKNSGLYYIEEICLSIDGGREAIDRAAETDVQTYSVHKKSSFVSEANGDLMGAEIVSDSGSDAESDPTFVLAVGFKRSSSHIARTGRQFLIHKVALLLATLVCVVLSITAECILYTSAMDAHNAAKENKKFSSMRVLEAKVWKDGLTVIEIFVYEAKSLCNSISTSATLMYVLAFGLGLCHFRKERLFMSMIAVGSITWALQTSARLSSDALVANIPVAGILKTGSYVTAYVGWFLLIPISNAKLTSSLARGALLPLVIGNTLFAFFLVVLERVFYTSSVWPKLIFITSKFLELVVAVVQERFHSVASCGAIMSMYLLYPLGSAWIWRSTQQNCDLSITFRTSIISFLSLLCSVHLRIMAAGAVTPHTATVLLFPLQLLEHILTKYCLASSMALEVDFICASFAQYVSLFFMSTQYGRQVLRWLLRPLWEHSPTLRHYLGELIMIDQPAWKALMLVEIKVIRSANECTADFVATCVWGAVFVQQTVLQDLGVGLPAFNVGLDTSWWKFGVAWGYLFILSAIVSFFAPGTLIAYLERVKRRYSYIKAQGPEEGDILPRVTHTQSRLRRDCTLDIMTSSTSSQKATATTLTSPCISVSNSCTIAAEGHEGNLMCVRGCDSGNGSNCISRSDVLRNTSVSRSTAPERSGLNATLEGFARATPPLFDVALSSDCSANPVDDAATRDVEHCETRSTPLAMSQFESFHGMATSGCPATSEIEVSDQENRSREGDRGDSLVAATEEPAACRSTSVFGIIATGPTRLDRYMEEASTQKYHARFEPFRELTFEQPAFLMGESIHPRTLHNCFVARHFGFFLAASAFTVTQMIYELSLTQEFVEGAASLCK